MSKNDVLNQLLSILVVELDFESKDVQADKTFADIGLDEVDLVEALISLEEHISNELENTFILNTDGYSLGNTPDAVATEVAKAL